MMSAGWFSQPRKSRRRPRDPGRRQTSKDLREGTHVLQLPRKMQLMCSKRCTCHASSRRPIVINRRRYLQKGPGKRRPATIDYYGRRLLFAWQALGAHQLHFAWQAQQMEHLSFILRGRRRTWSTSVSYCVQVQYSTGSISRDVRGRGSTWTTSASFCVAGAAHEAPQSHFAWQVQHRKHLDRAPKKGRRRLITIGRRLPAWQVQHLEHHVGAGCSMRCPCHVL